MADEEEKQGEGEGEGEKAKKKPLILILAIGVVAVILLGAVGFFILNRDSSDSDSTEDRGEEAELQDDNESEQNVVIYDLEPFIVNLADKGDVRYLKLSLKLELKKESAVKTVDARLAHIRDSMLILLSSKDFESIRTVEGKMQLRDEIIHRINTILDRRLVKTAYFTEFVSQ